MKAQGSIPTSKVARATQFLKAGVQVGGNYIKHYSKKVINPSLTKDDLHRDNAADIYASLAELKGSALKVAQMMSMEKHLLPKAYSEQFMMAQYSARPLSAPLIIKTFRTFFGKSPNDLFDTFDINAQNAASIGQVHRASKNGKSLAVKVQYPGVGDSVSSDLKIARPLAVQLLNLNDAEINRYFVEVESKLLEETDYELELKRSVEISEACGGIKNIFFPKYYPELSCKRILTMDWLDGMHLNEFLKTNPSQIIRNQLGQALWDFYDFQINDLRKVHADPHPGNFLMTPDGKLGVIDFGCVKVIPTDFYDNYFELINPTTQQDLKRVEEIYKILEFIVPSDTPQEQVFFRDLFSEMTKILSEPFSVEKFDFGNAAYFDKIYTFAERLSNLKELKNSKIARGSQHGLYINRTYFGLYSLLGEIKAEVITSRTNVSI